MSAWVASRTSGSSSSAGVSAERMFITLLKVVRLRSAWESPMPSARPYT